MMILRQLQIFANHWVSCSSSSSRSPPSASSRRLFLSLSPLRMSSTIMLSPLPTLQMLACPSTMALSGQEVVLYPGSLTLILSPLQEQAKTQWAPAWTFRITTSPWSSLALIWLFATLPWQVSPRELMEPHTNKSPLTQPPCPLSQALRVDGLQLCPVPARAIEAELMRQPALQIVFEEVPSCSFAHLASHCLNRGQVRAQRATIRAMRITSLIQ